MQNDKKKKISKILISLLIILLPLNSISAKAVNNEIQKPIQYKTDRFIVKYKKEASGDIEKSNAVQKAKTIKGNSSISKNLNIKKMGLINTDKKMTVEEIKEELNIKNEEIEYIQPDYQLSLLSNDPYLSYQWGTYNQEEIKTEKYNETVAERVYEEITYRIDANVKPAWEENDGEGITVAVIDTGIDITHEDLRANIWQNPNEIEGNSIDDDGNGYIDDINGWNFYEETSKVYDEDSTANEWHGTHIAGIIAGE